MSDFHEKDLSILYVLAQYNFFLEGMRGRVSHAKGFVSGLSRCGQSAKVLSGPNATRYLSGYAKVISLDAVVCGKVAWWFFFAFSLAKELPKSRQVVVRWRPLWFVWGLLLFPYRGKVWFEINSLTGVDSRNILVRNLSKFSLTVVCRLFNVIVVSEGSRSLLEGVSKIKEKIYVMPNGFHDEIFASFSPLVSDKEQVNMVYFGRKQPYYDWNIAYRLAENLSRERMSGPVLHIFGFEEERREGVIFHGEFNDQVAMLHEVSLISNPVMILPASDSDVARAGSPMKLYEYGALGVPIIISSSLRQQAEKMPQALFYAAGSYNDFCETVDGIRRNYHSLFLQRFENRELVVSRYSWQAVVAQWLEKINDK